MNPAVEWLEEQFQETYDRYIIDEEYESPTGERLRQWSIDWDFYDEDPMKFMYPPLGSHEHTGFLFSFKDDVTKREMPECQIPERTHCS